MPCSFIRVAPARISVADYALQINILSSGATVLQQRMGLLHYFCILTSLLIRWKELRCSFMFVATETDMETNLDCWRNAGRLQSRIRWPPAQLQLSASIRYRPTLFYILPTQTGGGAASVNKGIERKHREFKIKPFYTWLRWCIDKSKMEQSAMETDLADK